MIICRNMHGGKPCNVQNRNAAKYCRQCGHPLWHPTNTLIGRYRVVRLIGRGGFGAVYVANDTMGTFGEVALKETAFSETIHNFQHEFEVLQMQRHPNLPHYYEVFEDNGKGYLVMEHIPGMNLHHVLRKQDIPLLETQVLGYALQLCDVLSYLHTQKSPIFHRDIKPSNIHLTQTGLIKLVDFGLVKRGTQETRSTIRGRGTPAYQPPEQVGGSGTDQRSDIYSLGATLYHLITGQKPPSVAERECASQDPLVPPKHLNSNISFHVSNSIMKAMQLYPTDRYQDITEFKKSLVGEVPSSPPIPIIAPPEPPPQPAPPLPHFPVALDEWEDEVEWLSEVFGDKRGYWCYVHAGTYLIGGWERDETSVPLSLQPYWIARFAVTVEQYEQFINVGYSDRARLWWTRQGWEWKVRNQRILPWLWDDTDFNQPDQPVIGVSWYEAAAFANWLNWHLLHVLPKGYSVRLPTEAEWEIAGTFDRELGRCRYPWGSEDPNPERVVYDQSKLEHPASVGSCPSGAAPCGAQDMAGNVWEWTTSSFAEYPEQSHKRRRDVNPNKWDVPLRGGSWWDHWTFLRCGIRERYRPDFHSHIFGFRLVVAPA